jgi:small subunit ribosomal protein S19e
VILPTPYDVPASILIERLARHLKEEVDAIAPPTWVSLVKTGSHVQRPPQNPDWWFARCASLLRKIYVKGPIGIERLRSEYGGRIGRGVRPGHARKGGGAMIRKALQQLQAAGLVEPLRNRGRIVTSEGRRLVDRLSTEIKGNLEKTLPELKKY